MEFKQIAEDVEVEKWEKRCNNVALLYREKYLRRESLKRRNGVKEKENREKAYFDKDPEALEQLNEIRREFSELEGELVDLKETRETARKELTKARKARATAYDFILKEKAQAIIPKLITEIEKFEEGLLSDFRKIIDTGKQLYPDKMGDLNPTGVAVENEDFDKLILGLQRLKESLGRTKFAV